MPRGLWKGAISFGLVNVPVELFSAQKREAGLDLTMLDKRDLAPVGYKRVNKASGKDVPWEDVVKGYEYQDDKYVVLSEEDPTTRRMLEEILAKEEEHADDLARLLEGLAH